MTEKIKLFIVKKFNSNLFILLVRENKHRKNGNMNNLCILPSFRFESFLFAFSWNIYELKQIPPGKTYNSLKFLHIYIQPAAICDGTILRDAGLIFTAAAEEHARVAGHGDTEYYVCEYDMMKTEQSPIRSCESVYSETIYDILIIIF